MKHAAPPVLADEQHSRTSCQLCLQDAGPHQDALRRAPAACQLAAAAARRGHAQRAVRQDRADLQGNAGLLVPVCSRLPCPCFSNIACTTWRHPCSLSRARYDCVEELMQDAEMSLSVAACIAQLPRDLDK